MAEFSSTAHPAVRVGIAEALVVHAPNCIRTTGLGSCVGVVVFDLVEGVAGMAHVMLPQTPPASEQRTPAKYADSAVPWLVKELCSAGARQANLRSKIAGGAQMFAFAARSELMRIGERNTRAVQAALQELSIPVLAADVGGDFGRTIEFDSQTGLLRVRTAMRGEYII